LGWLDGKYFGHWLNGLTKLLLLLFLDLLCESLDSITRRNGFSLFLFFILHRVL